MNDAIPLHFQGEWMMQFLYTFKENEWRNLQATTIPDNMNILFPKIKKIFPCASYNQPATHWFVFSSMDRVALETNLF